jgi:UDP-N-acetyl-2-amino-2-deoxyglucuronate dehydrogenase
MIKFAIIGAGYIGKRHATLIKENKSSELVAFIDIRSKIDCDIEKYNVPLFKSIEDFKKSNLEVDVFNICTPNGLHAINCLEVLDFNKHVVCEKPMAMSKVDCEKVMFKALEKSKHLFCVMQNRYSPPSKWLKSIIDEKILGEIYIVQINCYWNRDERYYKKNGWKGTNELDGGTLFTQFSHFIDIMYWLFGDITNIQGKFNDFCHENMTDFEDSGLINFEFKNGGMGCINYSTAVSNQNLESSITIIAENGSVKVGGQYMNEVEICNIKNYDMPELEESMPPNDYGYYKGSASNHCFIIQNVIDTLNGKSNPTTNILEGLKVVEIIERIYKLRDTKIVNKNLNKLESKVLQNKNYYQHETAIIDEGANIGDGSKIWHFSHICKGAIIGKNCNIGQNVYIADGAIIGDNCKVQNNVSIYSGVEAGHNVFFGPSCVLTNDINPRAMYSKNGNYMKTIIEDGVTLGANCTIVCGNTIGKHSLIGAGCVITKNVPANSIMVGNPGKKIGEIDEKGNRKIY